MKSASPLHGVIMCQPQHKAAIHSLAGAPPFDLSLEELQIYFFLKKGAIFDSSRGGVGGEGDRIIITLISFARLENESQSHLEPFEIISLIETGSFPEPP